MEDTTQSRRFSILKPNNDGDEPTSRSTIKFGLRKSESRRVSFSTFKEIKEFCPVSTINDMTEMPDCTLPVELSSSTNSESTPASDPPCGSRILQRTTTTWRDENVMEQTLILNVKETDMVDKENIIHHQLNKVTKAFASQLEYGDVVDSAGPLVGNLSYAGMELTMPLYTQLPSAHLTSACPVGHQAKELAPDNDTEDDGMDLTDTGNPAIIVADTSSEIPADDVDDKPAVAGPSDCTFHQLSMDLTTHVSGEGIISVCREDAIFEKCTTEVGPPEEAIPVTGEQHIQEVSMGLVSHHSSVVTHCIEQEAHEPQDRSLSGTSKETTIPRVEEKPRDMSMDLTNHPNTNILVLNQQVASVARQSAVEVTIQQDVFRSSEQKLQEVSMELTSHPLTSQISAPNVPCEENAMTALAGGIQHISMNITSHVSAEVELNPEALLSPDVLANPHSHEPVIMTGFVAEKAAELASTPPSDVRNNLEEITTKELLAEPQAVEASQKDSEEVFIEKPVQKDASAAAAEIVKKIKKKGKKKERTESAESDTGAQSKRLKSSVNASKTPMNAGVKRTTPLPVGPTERTHSEKKLPRLEADPVHSVVVKKESEEIMSEELSDDSDYELEDFVVKKEEVIERDGLTLFLRAYKGRHWKIQRESNALEIGFIDHMSVKVNVTLGPEYMERGVKNWVIDDIKLSTLRKKVKSCWGRLALKLVENNPGAKSAALLKTCDCTSKLQQLMNHLESLIEPMIVFLNDDANRFKGYCYRHVWDEDKHTLTMRFSHFFTESFFDLHMKLSETFPLKAVESKIEMLEEGSVKSKDIAQLLQIISAVRAENPYFTNVGKCVADFLDCLPRVPYP